MLPWLPVITISKLHVHIVSAQEGHLVKGDLNVWGVGDGFPNQQQVGCSPLTPRLLLYLVLHQLSWKLDNLTKRRGTQYNAWSYNASLYQSMHYSNTLISLDTNHTSCRLSLITYKYQFVKYNGTLKTIDWAIKNHKILMEWQKI